MNDNITKYITNTRDASTPKLNLATKIYHVDSFVVFSSIFLLCSDLKFDLMFFIQLVWWIRTHQILEKFDQAKMFQFSLYTLSNLFDSTHLIKLIWLCIGGNISIVDWFKELLFSFSFLKILLVNLFVKTGVSVNLFVFFTLSPVILWKKQCFFLIFSNLSVHVGYLGFHMLLCFEHQVFLPLDYVFSY